MRSAEACYRNAIDPLYPYPLGGEPRYRLSPETLGRWEHLAQARSRPQEVSAGGGQVWPRTNDSEQVLVQSVLASSEIEGEGIPQEALPLDLAAVTEAAEHAADAELRKRLAAVRDITEAGIWAMSRDSRTFVTFDFVLELHRRMFVGTKPTDAGKLKTRRNHIRGGLYDLAMLPPEKTAEFLRELCARTEGHLKRAERHGERSAFLTIAEFVCDFLAIHPFADGNGRAARLLLTCLLDRAGYSFVRIYPLDQVILETRADFYRALYESQKRWYLEGEDLTPWMEYYTRSVYIQSTRAQQRLRDRVTR
jgi:Fic family protein